MEEVVIKQESADVAYKEFVEIEIDCAAIFDQQSKQVNTQIIQEQLIIEYEPTAHLTKPEFSQFSAERKRKNSDALKINNGLDVKRELKEERNGYVNSLAPVTAQDCDNVVESILAKYLVFGKSADSTNGNNLQYTQSVSSKSENKGTHSNDGYCDELSTFLDSESDKRLQRYYTRERKIDPPKQSVRNVKASKKHHCDVCSAVFTQQGDLNDHKLSHKQVFKCPKCTMCFGVKENLRIHQIHCGDRTFECNVCQKSFYRKSHLRQHVKTHTGLKPFHCTVCNTQFTEAGSLRRHLSKFHNIETGFKCTFCNRRFKHLLPLQGHMFAVHGKH